MKGQSALVDDWTLYKEKSSSRLSKNTILRDDIFMGYWNLLFVFLLSIFGVIGSFPESNANERKTISLVQQIGHGDFDRGLRKVLV